MTSTSTTDNIKTNRNSKVPYKILLVDDSAIVRMTIRKWLIKHDFEVVDVSSGQDALLMVEQQRPDIILTDVQMPKMNGFELCEKLKSDAATSDIPILFLTSEESTDQKLYGLSVGGSDYITKSASEAEIIARTKTHARISRLQHELKHNRDELVRQLASEREHVRKERELHKQIEAHKLQLLQSDKMASVGQLAAGVAHEINNPVGFISSNLNSLNEYVGELKKVLTAYDELLSACQNQPEMKTPVQHVQRLRDEAEIDYILSDISDLIIESIDGTNRVRKIVSDLRDFSHVDSPDTTEENINELLDKTINVAWNELKYKTEIIKEYGDIPVISCYGGKLGQVFLNLLVNAAQAIEDQGRITVRTGKNQNQVWVEIADTGRGIPEENLTKIFDPFFTTKEVGKGTGLGLNLAHQIIKAHGGSLDVESTVGKGTTFRIELPVTGPAQSKEQKNECA